jgi:phytanoyl-CoA hydroxylase
VKRGSVVFFNGYTLHSSLRNKTPDCFRTALVNHYMSAESMLPWDQDGKLPPTEDLRDVVLVAGTDPYAWKGTVDVNKPYLRPDVLDIKTQHT